VSIDPDEQPHGRQDLAGALRKLRKAAGLSGERLAARCAMSQTKISRIESGRLLPSVVDVERILKALQVPDRATEQLLTLTRQANVEHTSWRTVAEMGLWRKQAELKALADSSTVMRHFLPAVPSGLLQVPEYARATLSPVLPGDPARDVEKAVQARIDRQASLQNVNRQFNFVLTDQAVHWRYDKPSVMERQCRHMAKISLRENVNISIIPQSVTVGSAPLGTFVIYDQRLVLVELYSGEVALRDPRDVSYHLEIFDYFLSRALTGKEATSFLLSVADEFMQECD